MTAARGHDVADGGTELPGLLQGQNPGRIRSHLRFRREEVAAHCFDNEIRSDVAASGEPSTCLPLAEVLNPLDKIGALDVRVKRDRGAECKRCLATVPDRVDGDDLRCPLNSCALNRGESDGACAQDDNVRAGLDANLGHRCRKATETGVVQHRELHRRNTREHRDAGFLEHNHQLRATRGKARHLCSVQHFRYRCIWIPTPVGQQTVIGAPANAVVTLAALSRARHDDSVAHRHPVDLRSDLDDGADATMTRDEGVRHVGRSQPLRGRRIADLGGFAPEHNLPR